MSLRRVDRLDRPAPFQPVRMCDVEISRPLPHVRTVDPTTGLRYASTNILVRLHTEPLGTIEASMDPSGIAPGQLAHLIWRDLADMITSRLAADGSTCIGELPVTGLCGANSTYLRERAGVLASAPPISVVVATRDPDDQIAACLSAIDHQDYPDYEVIVVDNASSTGTLTRVLQSHSPRVPLRCIKEPRPGVSRARNAGWHDAANRIVAFLDDDVIADPHWLAEIARGFAWRPDVRAVTGPILPVALDTQAQDWFEQAGGHVKGRGWERMVFDRPSHTQQHPLYPLPPFGATGNLAVDKEVIASMGGFDVALGPGTRARSGEDMAFLCDLMLAGHTLVYQPSALVRHHHHAEWSNLKRQFFGYGMGLTAFYSRMVLRDPRHLATLARLAPTALRDVLGTGSSRTARMRVDYPSQLETVKRRGMLYGPLAYLHSRWEERRARPVPTARPRGLIAGQPS